MAFKQFLPQPGPQDSKILVPPHCNYIYTIHKWPFIRVTCFIIMVKNREICLRYENDISKRSIILYRPIECSGEVNTQHFSCTAGSGTDSNNSTVANAK